MRRSKGNLDAVWLPSPFSLSGFGEFSGPSLLVPKQLRCPRTSQLSQPLPGSGCVELPKLVSEWKPLEQGFCSCQASQTCRAVKEFSAGLSSTVKASSTLKRL